MKRRLTALLGTPLILWGTAVKAAPWQADAPARAEQPADPQADVLALERAWLDAYQARDVAAMETIVGDEFAITFPDGRMMTKADVLAQIRGPGRSPLFSTEGVEARRFGDTVILTGTLVTETSRGRQLNRYTDTWVRRAGRWQVVASHLSAAPTP